MFRARRHWLLLVIPYLWIVFAVPLINRIHYEPGGIPFLMLWMGAGVVVTSLSVGAVFSIDRRRKTQGNAGSTSGTEGGLN